MRITELTPLVQPATEPGAVTAGDNTAGVGSSDFQSLISQLTGSDAGQTHKEAAAPRSDRPPMALPLLFITASLQLDSEDQTAKNNPQSTQPAPTFRAQEAEGGMAPNGTEPKLPDASQSEEPATSTLVQALVGDAITRLAGKIPEQEPSDLSGAAVSAAPTSDAASAPPRQPTASAKIVTSQIMAAGVSGTDIPDEPQQTGMQRPSSVQSPLTTIASASASGEQIVEAVQSQGGQQRSIKSPVSPDAADSDILNAPAANVIQDQGKRQPSPSGRIPTGTAGANLVSSTAVNTEPEKHPQQLLAREFALAGISGGTVAGGSAPGAIQESESHKTPPVGTLTARIPDAGVAGSEASPTGQEIWSPQLSPEGVGSSGTANENVAGSNISVAISETQSPQLPPAASFTAGVPIAGSAGADSAHVVPEEPSLQLPPVDRVTIDIRDTTGFNNPPVSAPAKPQEQPPLTPSMFPSTQETPSAIRPEASFVQAQFPEPLAPSTSEGTAAEPSNGAGIALPQTARVADLVAQMMDTEPAAAAASAGLPQGKPAKTVTLPTDDTIGAEFSSAAKPGPVAESHPETLSGQLPSPEQLVRGEAKLEVVTDHESAIVGVGDEVGIFRPASTDAKPMQGSEANDEAAADPLTRATAAPEQADSRDAPLQPAMASKSPTVPTAEAAGTPAPTSTEPRPATWNDARQEIPVPEDEPRTQGSSNRSTGTESGNASEQAVPEEGKTSFAQPLQAKENPKSVEQADTSDSKASLAQSMQSKTPDKAVGDSSRPTKPNAVEGRESTHEGIPGMTAAADPKSVTIPKIVQPSSPRPAEFVYQLADRIQTQLQAGQGEVRIQLKPEHLGNLEIRAENGVSGIVARIAAESGGVKQFLESNIHTLQQSLQEQGLKVDRIDVVLQAGLDARQSGNAQQQPGQTGNGQSGSNSHGGNNGGRSASTHPQDEILVDSITAMVLGPHSTFHTIA